MLRTVAVVFALSIPCLLRAQLNRGVIEGVVTDPTGAVVPAVVVTITSDDTNISVTTQTNSTGYYRGADLVPGKYHAHFEASGFTGVDITGIQVLAGQVIKVDARVQLGSSHERVQVTAEAPLLETAPSNASTSLEKKTIEEVPLQGRDLQQLVFLLPGVQNVAGPPGSNFGFNSQFGTFPDPTYVQGSDVSVNGGQGGANAWYLDGNLNLSTLGENISVNPSPDAVSEFQSITNSFAAEYSRTGGGVFSVVLKSGGNAVHGSLYEYVRNSATDARNPFNSIDAQGHIIKSRDLHFNDFGGTLGGPLVIPHLYDGRNKTFFFFSLDQTVLHLNGTQIFSVPTALMRQGNFSEDPNAATFGIWNPWTTTGPIQSGPDQGLFQRTALGTPLVTDGCTNTVLDNSPGPTCNFSTQIPDNMQDPVAKFFINSYPLPNFNDPNSTCPMGASGYLICHNYLGGIGTSQNPLNLSIKIDQQASAKSKYFAEFLFNPGKYNIYRLPWTGATFPSVGWGAPIPVDFANTVAGLGNTYVFSPSLINEFRASFSRQYINSHPSHGAFPNSVSDLSEAEKVLAPSQIFLAPGVPNPSWFVGMPEGNGSGFGNAGFINMLRAGEAYTILDNVTKIMGRHTLKTGFMYRLEHDGRLIYDPTQLNFAAGGSNLVVDPKTTLGGFGLEQFMFGAPSPGATQTGLTGQPYQRDRYWGFYVQDDFRVTPSFTLNLGVRYDIQGWWKSRQQPMSNFCLNCSNALTGLVGKMIYSGDPQLPAGHDLFSANKRDFGPRFNFSYSPFKDRKTVIRGGFDVFYTNATNALNNDGQGVAPGPLWQIFAYWLGSWNPSACKPYFGQCAPWSLSDTTTNKATLTQPPIPADELSPAQHRDPGLGQTLQFYAPPAHDPLVVEWSFDVQRELPGNMMIDIGYVGTHGTHLAGDTFRNYNYVHTADLLQYKNQINTNVPVTNYFSGDTASLLTQTWGSDQLPLSLLLKTYPFFGSIFSQTVLDGTTIYQGLNVKLQKRYSHGLNFIAAYTLSKKIDNPVTSQLAAEMFDPIHAGFAGNVGGRIGAQGVAFASGFSGVFGGGYQDPDNRKADRTIAIDDIPQQYNLAITYELPFGAGKAFANHQGPLNAVIGGWLLTGNFNAESGTPLRITGPCNQITCRPDLVGNPQLSKSRPKAQRIADWINGAAFLPPYGADQSFWANYDPNDPRAWQFGTAGLYLPGLRSPGYWNLDSSLSKQFHVRESKYLEFRWELYNALNHQNLGLPNTNFCLPPGPGGETDAVRQVGCAFGQITNIQTDPRSMQFSLRFVF